MLLDSFAHAEDDVKARLLAEQRVEADRILAAARAAMRDAPELLETGEREAIERALAAVEAARAGSDHHAIRAAIEALDHASKPFAHAADEPRAASRGSAAAPSTPSTRKLKKVRRR